MFEPVWLERARVALDQLQRRFGDNERGGFFATEASDGNVLVRMRDDYDGAEPAASSLAALAFLKLAALLDDEGLRVSGRRTIEAFGARWKRSPRSMPLMLVAGSRFLEADQQVVVVGDRESETTRKLLVAANRWWRAPYSVLLFIDREAAVSAVFGLGDRLSAMREATGKCVCQVFVCENFACKETVRSVESLEELLR